MPGKLGGGGDQEKLGQGREPIHGHDPHQAKPDEVTPTIRSADESAGRDDHYEAADHKEQINARVAVLPWAEPRKEVVVQQQRAVESDDEESGEGPKSLNALEWMARSSRSVHRCKSLRIHVSERAACIWLSPMKAATTDGGSASTPP